ncbi:MAG: DUF3467 domain-containing protein [Candidatus Marsarchaeota archaeon]|nr:DUF3467 domain-containing protein [Candidatus Marsarchaeota archaeon]
MSDINEVNEIAEQEMTGEVKKITLGSIPRFYANTTNVAVSVFDVRVLFLNRQPVSLVPSSDQQTLASEAVSVIMSPQHAKALAIILNDRIQGYEKEFGALPDRGKLGISLGNSSPPDADAK